MVEDQIEILSTKILDEAIVKQAASKNIIIDCIPFIEIVPVKDAVLTQKINHAVVKNNYAIFTSANAVQAVAAQLYTQPTWSVFCTAGATKASVEAHLKGCNIIGTAANGTSLSQMIIGHQAGAAVFFCGDKRLNIIPNALKEAGIPLEEMTVYHTILTPHIVKKKYDGIIFFSPSGVQSFCQVNTIHQNCVSFSMGNTTAKMLKKHTDKIVITHNTVAEEVCRSVISYFCGPIFL